MSLYYIYWPLESTVSYFFYRRNFINHNMKDTWGYMMKIFKNSISRGNSHKRVMALACLLTNAIGRILHKKIITLKNYRAILWGICIKSFEPIYKEPAVQFKNHIGHAHIRELTDSLEEPHSFSCQSVWASTISLNSSLQTNPQLVVFRFLLKVASTLHFIKFGQGGVHIWQLAWNWILCFPTTCHYEPSTNSKLQRRRSPFDSALAWTEPQKSNL